ncbi:MAG: hypothetical protein IIY02_04755 [Firmicutes bacterium]|nr:hypothetical protein [Bacillota bacterium]
MEDNNKLEKAKELYLMLLISEPGYPLKIYRDSVLILGSIIRGETADIRDIPYPLFCPVNQNLTGLDLAIEWMRQAIFENMILQCFPKDILSMLPSSDDAPVNLCEAVLLQAAGCILLKKDPFSLLLTKEEAKRITDRFRELGEEKSIAHLDAAKEQLCKVLRLDQPQGKEKIATLLRSMYERSINKNEKTLFRFIFS